MGHLAERLHEGFSLRLHERSAPLLGAVGSANGENDRCVVCSCAVLAGALPAQCPLQAGS